MPESQTLIEFLGSIVNMGHIDAVEERLGAITFNFNGFITRLNHILIT